MRAVELSGGADQAGSTGERRDSPGLSNDPGSVVVVERERAITVSR